MPQQTYQQYVEQALMVIGSVLPQYSYDLFEVTIETAWQLFRDYVETQPMSLLKYNYFYYGSRFQSELPLLWPAFQYEMARSLGLL